MTVLGPLAAAADGHRGETPPKCPWKIRYGTSGETTTQCGKDEHLLPDPLPGELQEHDGPGLHPGQHIIWYAGDRREYRGEWPGYCGPGETFEDAQGICVLPAGHRGRCAP